MLEINIPIGDFLDRVFRILHLRHFIEHLADTVCRRLRDHDLDEHECYHHQRRQDLDRIHDNTGKLSGLHGSADDTLSSDEHHDQHDRINGKLHDRRVPGNNLLRLCKQLEDLLRNLSELFVLIVFTHIRFDHACRIDIFLHRVVQDVIFIKHLDKVRMRFFRDPDQHTSQDRYRNKEDQRDRNADRHRHDQRKNDHDRRSRQQTDGKHICHLHVRNVRRQPGHKPGR